MRRQLEDWIRHDPLDRPPLVNRLLGILAGIFRSLGALEHTFYRKGWWRSRSLGIPTISVGNIAVGGTGKTPFTIWLAGQCAAAGLHTVVINKNYGGPHPSVPTLVSDGQDLFCHPGEVADEAWLTAISLLHTQPQNVDRYHPAHRLPSTAPRGVAVLAGKNRLQTWQKFRTGLKADLVILDDGFQHFEVTRDMDIVLLDSVDPLGGDMLLPVGRLREPAERLSRADHLVLTGDARITGSERLQVRSELERRVGRKWLWDVELLPGWLQPWSKTQRLPLETLRGRKILSFCGLAQPERFQAAINSTNPHHHHVLTFADHANYDATLLHEIQRAAVHADLVVTTAKDAVKLHRPTFARKLLILEQMVMAPTALAAEVISLVRPDREV